MRLPPLLLVFAAALATFAIAQAVLPTAHAQAAKPVRDTKLIRLACRAAVKRLHLTHTPHGLEVTGRIVNTGAQPLVYTSVVLTLRAAEQPAYLTAGPVRSGQSAEFRAVLPSVPTDITGAEIAVRLREAGQTIAVEQMPKP